MAESLVKKKVEPEADRTSPKELAEFNASYKGYRARAEAVVRGGGGDPTADPQKLLKRSESAMNELEGFATDSPESPLLRVDGANGLRWVTLIAGAAAATRVEIARPGSRKKSSDGDDDAYASVVERCTDVRQRYLTAIHAKKVERERYELLRSRLLTGNPTPQSKPAWENELSGLTTNLEQNGKHALELVGFLAPLGSALDQIRNVTAPPPGNQGHVRWSDSVVLAETALLLALNDLIAHAALHAPRKTLAALQRILQPKRSSEEGGDEKKDAEKKDAEKKEPETKTPEDDKPQ